ncbi:HsdM family class I SAM-dependent methyltransferase [Bacillus thuringiensis]|uniref:class I SAM-dependent DNA methyltransferase n=1 Tax=Bacillus thuringiensis TaxID=1428 RepID=UPI000BF658CA|nr:class I SAM-dependent DNA methyltransferase [Bacillus thuringiensis]PEV93978.1 SAM-dependent methyltransferase [Bacillus thuringiensis]PGS85283.1 SAM-dependent methyltransferase [Bacillus thuringiensis]PGT87508.1 SAM-dependent methyltransferase [Bacillus thuringiensis]
MSITNFVKSIQDIMRQDPGVDGDAQRISQLVWMLFLKIYDAKEEEEWEVFEDNYVSIIPEGLKWRDWAKADEETGQVMTGEELVEFINEKLFPTLKELVIDDKTEERAAIVKYVFEDAYNYMKNGTLIRQVVDVIEKIDFGSYEERHAFNDIYETILKDLQSAGNSGEYYTPRAVTEFVVEMLDPKVGETFADFACGTGGFLTCALEHMKKQSEYKRTGGEEAVFNGLIGIEKKPMPHLLAVTNLILHGVDAPKVKRDNSLEIDTRDILDEQKVDKIGMNPPFGGVEEKSVQTNFKKEFQTAETADLFMVLIMERLKENGKAGVVLPDGFLFGTDGVKGNIKEKLLREFNLHTIVRLPNGVFSPYTDITTNLLFFDKVGPTKEVWYYEHQLPEGYKKYTKTRPIRLEEFNEELEWWNEREENGRAWKVSFEDIQKNGYNLDCKNPNSSNNTTQVQTIDELLKNIDSRLIGAKDILLKIKEVLGS